jgi:hypothetical protein
MKTKQQANYIHSGGINDYIQSWQDKQPERVQDCASPSSLMDCPRVVWRRKHKLPITNPKTWAFKQRLLLGRNFENMIAKQLADEGVLKHHWSDGNDGDAKPFEFGEGETRLKGTPDLLIELNNKIAISDAKTGRSDGYAWVPVDKSVWEDKFWYKYKLQLTAYYILCHKNKDWFKEHKLPLPEICHLFSYAMDDGVIRREFTWKPNQKDASEVIYYSKRWNRAYSSKTEPDCTCDSKDAMFCPYSDLDSKYVTKKGKTLYERCCS